MNRLRYAPLLAGVMAGALAAQTRTSVDADELYRHREDLSQAARAADVWALRASVDFQAAWKLARACYWLGVHQPEQIRRSALERGVNAGESAIRLARGRPEGHFWMAANMGRLAESFGIVQGLKYRGRIKDEFEQVLAIDPAWEGGSADAALGEWYAAVPRLLRGSQQKAEQHFRRALDYDANNASALLSLGEMLAADKRVDEADGLLRRVIAAPFDAEWAPENREYAVKAAALLKRIEGATR